MGVGVYVLILWVFSAVYVQNRGKIKHKKLKSRITDHSNVLAPVNCLFYAFSKVPAQPYLNPNNFPELNVLTDHIDQIRAEAEQLNSQQAIKASDDLDDIGFNSFFKTGWRRFYLKWYGVDHGSAKRLCPETTRILAGIPSVKAAMFAMLPPGATLVRHRDPYAGSIRYHLGLQTPNDDACFIEVDGERYSWRDGEVVMFDETYIHHAENNTDKNRIVLFLDIKRPVTFKPIDWFNSLFSNVVMAASATKNTSEDRVGWINQCFASIYRIRLWGKKIKKFNKPLYYLIQYALYVGLIYLIFF